MNPVESTSTTDMMPHAKAKRAVGNFFSLSLLQVGNYLLPMITLPIIARIIGPANYGLINYAFAFVGYFTLLINAGFDLYGSRELTAKRNDKQAIDTIVSAIFAAKALLFLLSTLLFFLCIHFIPALQQMRVLLVFTYFICLGWVVNPSWLFHAMQDSRHFAWFSFTSKLLFSILVIVVVQQRDDYLYQPLLVSISEVLLASVAFVFAVRKYRIRIHLVSIRKITDTLKANFKMSVIWWVSNQVAISNILLAGLLFTSLELGHFSAALRIVLIFLTILSMPLNMVLFPYIGEAFSASFHIGMNKVRKILPYIFFATAGISVFTFLFSGLIINVFFGAEFSSAIPLLQVFSLILFFSTMNTAFGQQVLLHINSDTPYLKLVLLGFVLNMIFLLVLGSLFGITGAVWAWPLAEGIIFISYFIYFRRRGIHVIQLRFYRPKIMYERIRYFLKEF